jgi:hypothetical protein
LCLVRILPVRREATVLLRDNFRSVARSSLDRDSRGEDAAEVCDPQEQNKEHRQHEGEFDERLPSWPGFNLTAPSPSEMSQ